MNCLLQISDPHFGTEQPPVVEALLDLSRRLSPDVVVLSGDVTQRARRAQFDAARAFVDRLAPAPVIVLPGNHDVPLFNLLARACWPYAAHRRVFGDELEPVHADARWLVVGVKSTRRRRHKDGEVSDEQIERVAGLLAQAAPGQVRVVALHHPVAVCREQDVENLLHNREAAVRRWSAAGADLVLGGHIHLPYVLPLSDEGRPLPRHVWAVQAGTAVSSRVRHEAGNSVNVVRRPGTAADRVSVERWDYGAAAGRFEQASSDELPLSRDRPGAGTDREAPP